MVSLGDPALYNFLYVNRRIVTLDFEFSYPLPSDITNADNLETLKDDIQKRMGQAQHPNPGSGFSARPLKPPTHHWGARKEADCGAF